MGVRGSLQERGSGTKHSRLKALGQQAGLSGWILVTPDNCNSCLTGVPSCLHFLHQSAHHTR